MLSMLSIITLLPLVGAIVVGLMPVGAKQQIRLVALLATLIPAVLSFLVLCGFHLNTQGMQFETHSDWITLPFALQTNPLKINYDLGVDGLSLPLLLLTAVVSVLAVIAAWNLAYRVKAFFIWTLILVTGLYGVFVSEDLFLFFFFLELTLIPMYFLLLGWGGEKKQVATKFLIYRGLASVAILIAFVGLAYQAAVVSHILTMNVFSIADSLRTPNITNAVSDTIKHGLFGVLFLGVLIEEAFFPFHTWLPDTHEQAHPAVSMLVGGVLMKIGAYILIRMGVGVLPDAVSYYGTAIAALGVVNILYGALVAMVQRDWRRLVAFGTISHMGIFLLAVASLTPAGIQGAMLMMVSSGLLSGLLFFLLGLVQHRTNTLLIDRLGGLSKRMPIISGVLLVGALGSLGLPGLSGFMAELLSFMGGFARYPFLSMAGTLGIVLAAVYFLWAVQRTTFGPTLAVHEQLKDASLLDALPIVVFLALIILVGVYPASVGDMVNGAMQTYLRIGG